MMQDDFIENVITPKPQTREEAIMNREFYGMEAVKNSEKTNADEDERSESE